MTDARALGDRLAAEMEERDDEDDWEMEETPRPCELPRCSPSPTSRSGREWFASCHWSEDSIFICGVAVRSSCMECSTTLPATLDAWPFQEWGKAFVMNQLRSLAPGVPPCSSEPPPPLPLCLCRQRELCGGLRRVKFPLPRGQVCLRRLGQKLRARRS